MTRIQNLNDELQTVSESDRKTWSSFLLNFLKIISISSVVDQHHVDADPNPTFYFNVDPDPDPSPSFTHYGKSFCFDICKHNCPFTLIYLRCQVSFFQYFGEYFEIFWKKTKFSFKFGWNGYGSGSAGPGCRPVSGTAKIMMIRPNPDPQQCIKHFLDLLLWGDSLGFEGCIASTYWKGVSRTWPNFRKAVCHFVTYFCIFFLIWANCYVTMNS